MPQTGDRTTTQDAQGFTPSRIDVVGRRVIMEADSLLRAPAGEVTISAQTAPLFQVPGSPAVGDVRVYVAPGARIDVSGTQGVTLSVERNFIDVELRGNELRDSPLLRDSFVRGQKVTVDIRKGTPIGEQAFGDNPCFLLTDHIPMPKKTFGSLDRLGATKLSLGSRMLFASQCVVLIHHALDQR